MNFLFLLEDDCFRSLNVLVKLETFVFSAFLAAKEGVIAVAKNDVAIAVMMMVERFMSNPFSCFMIRN